MDVVGTVVDPVDDTLNEYIFNSLLWCYPPMNKPRHYLSVQFQFQYFHLIMIDQDLSLSDVF